MSTDELDALRAEVARIDTAIVELIARRLEAAAQLGRAKREAGSPLRDFAQEKEVLERARRLAAGEGVPEDLVERVMLELIRSSLTVQERGQVEEAAAGSGRTALVVGGAGKMGGWFVEFLGSQGFAVSVADPAATPPVVSDWREASGPFDLYVVATPIVETQIVLGQMAQEPPPGLIFDIGSLKTLLRAELEALAGAGARVASVHPMFGPDTQLLSGRHVVVVDVGVPEATAAARDLFASTMATLVEMDLDSHDRLIAYVLGLSHALNIAFFTALAESGETAGRLAHLSSTTFDNQLEVATQVAAENPHLYFEIQALNDYGQESLSALAEAVDRLRTLVGDGDEEGFVALMETGAAYLRSTRVGKPPGVS
ncbi:MAG TPA: prephenate dehydrogenase/arogenate dehydrogenase family protein [Acidimicrobiia bacterium]|nr:prephenate dehydrogenase/arogenate dehydrogenase family protein [Acidimicrobiia bacterium]